MPGSFLSGLLFYVKLIFEPMYLPLGGDIIYKNITIGSVGMTQGEESILIVARPERLREALRVLLTPMPRLDTINSVDNVPSALKTVVEQAPRLVLLDANLSDSEIKAALRQIKIEQPDTYCIVLAHSGRQEQMARLAGADEVVLKGLPAAGLLSTVSKVLLTPKNE